MTPPRPCYWLFFPSLFFQVCTGALLSRLTGVDVHSFVYLGERVLSRQREGDLGWIGYLGPSVEYLQVVIASVLLAPQDADIGALVEGHSQL